MLRKNISSGEDAFTFEEDDAPDWVYQQGSEQQEQEHAEVQ